MYAAEIVRRLTALEKAIRTSIVENDALGLTRSLLLPANVKIIPAGTRAWSGPNAAAKQKAFSQWLGTALAQMLEEDATTGQVPAWLKSFVKAAYSKGIQTATGLIEKSRPEIRQAITQIIGTPFHRERLEGIFERNFTELKGLTAAMNTKIQRALADGLTAGDNPKAMAARIAEETGISKSRARTIARTETIRTNAEAQLNTFERFGIRDVELDAEWITAGDDRVCPECEPREGKVFSIDEARGMIPLHPNCRCGWIPVILNREQTA